MGICWKLWSENFFLSIFWGEHREKKFVTFEKINSFKRGGVRAGFGGLVTIMSWVRCFWGSGRRFIFSKVKISFSEGG